MSKSFPNEQAVHERFSVECFNLAWDLLDRSDRSPEQDEEMIRLSVASTWHWTKRSDCTAENRSVGLWQTSRIHSVLGHTEEARRYASLCVQESSKEGVGVFFLAYAYEATARAEALAGNASVATAALEQAQRLLERIEDAEARSMLEQDLDDVRRLSNR